ncbi:MAG: glycosyltransferase family 2 protein [Opitutaceae bacterium]
MSPRVSIGLPVYNGANFLERSIDSILKQDFEDLELIVADNASTDATEAICRSYLERDSRIRYFRNESNVGAAGNYNKTFQLAQGSYFKWAAHDDECHQSMIGKCVRYLDSAPLNVAMVYPLGELIDEEGVTLESPLDRIASSDPRPYRRLSRVLWSLNMCDPVFGLIRADCLRRTQLIGPFFGADYVLLGELAMLGQIHEIPDVCFRLRAHQKRSMKANATRKARAAWYTTDGTRRQLPLPNWDRMILEMARSALRAEIPTYSRLTCCLAAVSTHYWRRFRNFGGRIKTRLLNRTARS